MRAPFVCLGETSMHCVRGSAAAAAIGAIALLVIPIATGCRRANSETDRPRRVDEQGRIVLRPEEESALGIETIRAAKGSVSQTLVRYGKVIARPSDDVSIIAPAAGRLATPSVVVGARVVAGDAIVSIEPLVDTASRVSLETQRREMTGQIHGARAQVDAKRAELERVTALVATGLATEADRARAQADLTSEQARADSLKRAGAELGTANGAVLPLRTLVAGTVATVSTDVGTWIPQGTVLARIVQPGPRFIDLAVAPSDPVGARYRISADADGGALVAKLASRGVVAVEGFRHDRLETEGPSDRPLPGETVAVEVVIDTDGIVVPFASIVRHGDQRIVFVKREAGRYEPRRVDVAAEAAATAAIGSGLDDGAEIVTRGAAALVGELGDAMTEKDGGAR